jgi:hypothetical protein
VVGVLVGVVRLRVRSDEKEREISELFILPGCARSNELQTPVAQIGDDKVR